METAKIIKQTKTERVVTEPAEIRVPSYYKEDDGNITQFLQVMEHKGNGYFKATAITKIISGAAIVTLNSTIDTISGNAREIDAEVFVKALEEVYDGLDEVTRYMMSQTGTPAPAEITASN